MSLAPTIMFVDDDTDPDNSVAVLAACNPKLNLNLAAVVVTGRSQNASLYARDPLLYSAKRMQGLINRHGYNVPVFTGLTATTHGITYVDSQYVDPYNDWEHTNIAGDFSALRRHISTLGMSASIVVTGAMTTLAALMRIVPASFFSIMATYIEPNRPIRCNQLSSASCDPVATEEVMRKYSCYAYMMPTNLVVDPSLGFKKPADLAKIGVSDEIVRMYEALSPRPQRIYLRSLNITLLMAHVIHAISTRGFYEAEKSPYKLQELYTAELLARSGVRITQLAAYSEAVIHGHIRNRFVVERIAKRPLMHAIRALNDR